jgi:hypothetical protein
MEIALEFRMLSCCELRDTGSLPERAFETVTSSTAKAGLIGLTAFTCERGQGSQIDSTRFLWETFGPIRTLRSELHVITQIIRAS